jgi:hypothetical protein
MARANVGQSGLKNVEGAVVTPPISRFLIRCEWLFLTTQNPVLARVCGFDPLLRHHRFP